MKTIRLLPLFCALFVWAPAVFAQEKCHDYACMIGMARDYKNAGNFEDAISSATAAMRYSVADKFEAEALIKEIFVKIDQLRTEAKNAELKATEAAQEAKLLAKIAQEERANALSAEIKANRLRRVAVAAKDSLAVLAKKGEELKQTFQSDTTAFDYLYATGLEYFASDIVFKQSRDYKNALTYFALARFLRPSDRLRYLVEASQLGIDAEADFIAGRLDEAETRYIQIELKLDSAEHEADFEKWRRMQIGEVRGLYQSFLEKHKGQVPDSILLEGNWWTLPHQFGEYQNVAHLTYKNNLSNFKRFPTALGKLRDLKSLTLADCPNVRELKDWAELKYLQNLSLHSNLNLYAIQNTGNATSLSVLEATTCPALTIIDGYGNLTRLAIRQSPQARLSNLLSTNPGLKKLELADLPEGSLDIGKLASLEHLSLARMNSSNLDRLGVNKQLKTLRIESLNSGSKFTLRPPSQMSSAYISHCDSLIGLGDWPASDSLNKLVLLGNNTLKALPKWKLFPNLETLLIQNSNQVPKVPDTKSLKNINRIFVVNNPNLITNNIQIGFGFDWGPALSSVKIEFEHRRRMHWRFVKDQDFGFKAVALKAWKNFYNPSPGVVKNSSEGFIAGAVVSYYSPYLVYTGIGMGYANLSSQFSDQSTKKTNHFVWINNLGVQIAPYFLRKDKVGVNMDLYTIFRGNDYFILPSFGLTYYCTLGFHRKTNFIRINEVRTRTFTKDFKIFKRNKKNRTLIEDLHKRL